MALHGLRGVDEGKGSEIEVRFGSNCWSCVLHQQRERERQKSKNFLFQQTIGLAFITLINRLFILLFFFYCILYDLGGVHFYFILCVVFLFSWFE